MANEIDEGALLTRSADVVVERLDKGEVAAATYGPAIYALQVALNNPEVMAELKGREKLKPFTLTTDHDHVNDVFGRPERLGLEPQTADKRLQAMEKLLVNSPRSLGVLFDLEIEDALPERVVGHGLIQIAGEKLPNTVSLMTSGPDGNFASIISNVDGHLLVGTSANYSQDGDRDRGSGHHHMGGLLESFGMQPNVVIHVPQELNENGRRGPSSPTYYVNKEGQVWTLRKGPITMEESGAYVQGLGLPYMGVVDTPRNIQPYDYEGFTIAGMLANERSMAMAYEYARNVTENGDIRWSNEHLASLARGLMVAAQEPYVTFSGHI